MGSSAAVRFACDRMPLARSRPLRLAALCTPDVLSTLRDKKDKMLSSVEKKLAI